MLSYIDCLKHNHIVGVQDTFANPGKYLIKEFISHSKESEIHLFCYDCDSNGVREELGSCQKSINFYDCLPELDSYSSPEDELQKFASSLSDRRCSSNNLLIIIDSVSTLFLQKPLPVVLKLLHQLSRNSICSSSGDKVRTQIVAVLHEDTLLTPRRIIAHMKIICRAWMRVRGRLVDVALRKKTGGKVGTVSYKYEGKLDDKIMWDKEYNVDQSNRLESSEGPVSTFKLLLSESEKKARDAVQLPYERSVDGNDSNFEAAIIYEPDEFDDWDEEDPDNDLEFS